MTKILVIEDETILRDEVVEWLTFEGYEAIGAQDGVAGVECALRDPPDLIICDIAMPRLDGFGVLLELHANAATIGVPFIFLTARAAHEDIRRGMILGADDYITKPFARQELLATVRTRLEKKIMQLQLHQREVEELNSALLQEREQRLFKARLIGMFSHDFRNPLTTIMSSNTLVRDYADRLDEARRLVHMNRIDASVRQLIQMLDDMLIVVQMDAGSMEFKPQLLDITQFFREIIEEFQALHNETHQLQFESHFSRPLMGDSRLLRQIGANLISNAIKYSPSGSVVRVSLSDEEGQCALRVSDQGIGIPEGDQTRLFEAFHRASNVGRVRGTGLGLAIVKQAVDLHGGAVSFESRVDAGTTFVVSIPVD